MTNAVIIGIHGLLNKPPKEILEGWWKDAIIEGIERNLDEVSLDFDFFLSYWADVRNAAPIAVSDLDEPYRRVEGKKPLRRCEVDAKDKIRLIAEKYGGRTFDKAKQFIGIGPVVEKLLAVSFEDLAEYYGNENTRRQIRSRLSELLEINKDNKILLIAHSMGSIVAYDVLRSYDETLEVKIGHFITIGSPLGLPLVSMKIREEFQKNRTPDCVEKWSNIADPWDKVAIDCSLSDEYDPNGKKAKVEDVMVYNSYFNPEGIKNNHKSYGYLRAPEVSDRIRDFLKLHLTSEGLAQSA